MSRNIKRTAAFHLRLEPLVNGDKVTLSQDMAIHCFQQLLPGESGFETERLVEGIDREVIEMWRAGRWSGSTVIGTTPAIEPLDRASKFNRQRCVRDNWHSFWQTCRGGRDTVNDPMDPGRWVTCAEI